MPSTGRKHVHIAAGAVRNARGEVLICQRPAHKIYPGEWEFPGGKVEPGEAAAAALARELREELGISVTEARPLIRLRHEYPELAVDLDTWLVTGWDGTPASNEHPASAWVEPDAMPGWKLLAADRPIVNALRLPEHCIFTPPRPDRDGFLDLVSAMPPSLLRLRWPELTDGEYAAWVGELAPMLPETGHRLIVDRDPALIAHFGADGFHATAAIARDLRRRPVPRERWFGISCHDAADLARAVALEADYAVLGPVRPTATHRGAAALGWAGFASLATGAGLPVYAIGGAGPGELDVAWRHGAQGVAGISAYWRGGGSSGGARDSSSTGME